MVELNHDHLTLVVSLIWCLIGFITYYLLSRNQTFSGAFRRRFPSSDQSVVSVILQRTWGVLFLGIITIVLVLSTGNQIRLFGLGFRFFQSPPWWSYLLLMVVIGATYVHSFSQVNLSRYPQIRTERWTWRILLLSAGSWTIFLIAYEFLFRGLLLFASLKVLDPISAIVLNTALYALAHFYKGPIEVFGAIPLGILLCYLTLLTGNIWSAVVIHLTMALSNEWFSLIAHPDMKLKRA